MMALPEAGAQLITDDEQIVAAARKSQPRSATFRSPLNVIRALDLTPASIGGCCTNRSETRCINWSAGSHLLIDTHPGAALGEQVQYRGITKAVLPPSVEQWVFEWFAQQPHRKGEARDLEPAVPPLLLTSDSLPSDQRGSCFEIAIR
jgi:hypothetical protein